MIALGSELQCYGFPDEWAWYSTSAPILAPWCVVFETVEPGVAESQIVAPCMATTQLVEAGIAESEVITPGMATSQIVEPGIVADEIECSE